MKRIAIVSSSALALAVLLLPVGASAHSGSWSNQKNRWVEKTCQRIDWRSERINSRFDQDRQGRLNRLQHLINRDNRLNCPVEGTIVDNLVKNGNFNTLVAAVGAANLGGALSAPGDKTVFAPTDQAFAKLPAGTVESLLANTPALTDILTYHVVGGASVNAATAKTLTTANALNGDTLNISVRHGSLFINDSKVILYDIRTTNGIIHVIDTVLLPPS